MPFAAILLFGLGLWIFSEIFVFGLVTAAIGLGGAILITLLTSLLGAVLLRRLGRTARQELRAVLKDGVIRLTPRALESGILAALGSVLLILPGFLSDCVGLALLAPTMRRPSPPTEKPDVIDLSPQDWRHIDEHDRN